jgi:hypothetical protein
MKQVQQEIADTGTPKYTGKQNLLGVEAAPLRAIPAAENQASTQP